MILPGHIAAAFIASKALRVSTHGALAASMCPDTIDKPIRWLTRVTPNDRIPAHSLLFWGATAYFAWRLADRSFAKGWAVGYGVHLLCDEVNAHFNPGRIYPWWPFKRYAYHTGPTGLKSSLGDFSPISLALEACLALLGIGVWWQRGGGSALIKRLLTHEEGTSARG
ncbi:MAG: metal-dependent hydrolase [Chloroflexi bacterium]|nr:metal-dependent hydrolase [Chloroflexota bacterium]